MLVDRWLIYSWTGPWWLGAGVDEGWAGWAGYLTGMLRDAQVQYGRYGKMWGETLRHGIWEIEGVLNFFGRNIEMVMVVWIIWMHHHRGAQV